MSEKYKVSEKSRNPITLKWWMLLAAALVALVIGTGVGYMVGENERDEKVEAVRAQLRSAKAEYQEELYDWNDRYAALMESSAWLEQENDAMRDEMVEMEDVLAEAVLVAEEADERVERLRAENEDYRTKVAELCAELEALNLVMPERVEAALAALKEARDALNGSASATEEPATEPMDETTTEEPIVE